MFFPTPVLDVLLLDCTATMHGHHEGSQKLAESCTVLMRPPTLNHLVYCPASCVFDHGKSSKSSDNPKHHILAIIASKYLGFQVGGSLINIVD